MIRTSLVSFSLLVVALACGGGGPATPVVIDLPPAPAPAPKPPPRVVVSFVMPDSSMDESEFDVFQAEFEAIGAQLGRRGITHRMIGADATVSGVDARTSTSWSKDLGPARGKTPHGLIAYEVGKEPLMIEANAYTIGEAPAALSTYFGADVLPAW